MQGLIQLVIALGVLIIAWLITERFSPDPLITRIVQIILFVIALIVIFKLLLPLVGVSL
jgi:hypothetical protein